MDYWRFNRNLISISLATIIAVTSIIPAFADNGTYTVSSTIPAEQPTLSSTTTLLSTISEGKPFHNIIDYIGYKNITVSDMDAIKWSFILSQMSAPLEESLEDVLLCDIVQQMKTQNLKISTVPESTDRDYTYDSVGTDFQVDSYEFAEIYSTIKNNLRYNRLWDKTGNQYTVRSFYNSTRRKENVGYISDYIYTNKSQSSYDELTQLPEKVNILYSYDDVNSASALVEFWKHPEKLITNDGSDVLKGQRRFVPVFVGSNLTDFYLQLGIMCYCKRNAEQGMNYDKFIDLYGNCEVWIDSFGNIVFFDSSTEKYKMILPNACNPVFTSIEGVQENVSLFPDEYLDTIKELNNGSSTEGIDYTEDDLIDNLDIDLWSERGFIYNKWLGSVYSTKRRTTTSDEDSNQYYFNNEDDLEKAYYPAYLGPIDDSRIDYRNSVVIVNPIKTFLYPDISKYVNQPKTLWNDLLNVFNKYSVGAVSVPMDNGNDPTVYSDITSYYQEDGSYLPMSTVLFNTILAEGQKATKNVNEGELTSYSVYIMYTLAQYCDAFLIQTASDTVLPTISDMELLKNKGGGIAQFIPSNSLEDVSNPDLLGEDGGYLEDSKNFILERYVPESTLLDISNIFDLAVAGLNYWYTGEAKDEEDPLVYVGYSDYSIGFKTKRDNRISNRFVNVPSDDFAIISYTWLNDYLDRIVFAQHYENSDNHLAVKNYVETASTSTDNYKDNYLLLPFNVNSVSSGTYELTTCMLPLQNANDAHNFYRYADGDRNITSTNSDGEVVGYDLDTPCTNRADINSYALLIGLYKNTDTQFNVNNSVDLIDVDNEVSISNLAQKVNYGVDNGIEVIANTIAGFAQYIHNAIAVKVTSCYTVALESELFKQLRANYIAYISFLIIVVFIIQCFKIILRRDTVYGGVSSTLRCFAVMLAIPMIFTLSQKVNKFIMDGMMQSVVDRTTLISVQKTIDGLINTEATAEKNWKAYRQQFSSLSDVFDDGYIIMPDGLTSDGVSYKKESIDKLVSDIKYLGAGSDSTGLNDNNWYEIPYKDTAYPLYTRYKSDVTKYFYDNLVGNYMTYYQDKPSTDQGLIIGQYTAIPTDDVMERTKVTDRLDRILHSLKGGFNPILLDSQFTVDHDILGIARFFNQDVVNPYLSETPQETQPNIREYLPLVETDLRKDKDYKLKVDGNGNKYLPYTRAGLEIQTGGKHNVFEHQFTKREDKRTPFEVELISINESALKRINNLLKYRPGEFSDTALMYTSAIIIVEELTDSLSDIKYGAPDSTDLDKMLRLVVCNNTEDIYNTEPIMYILQDTVSGGAALTLIFVIIELLITFGNLASIFICAFASILMPLLVKHYFDGINPMYKHQLLGVSVQIFMATASLYLINLPFKIGSILANKPMGDFKIWLFCLCCLVLEIFCGTLMFKMLKLISRDFATMGGSVIASSLTSSGIIRAQTDQMDSDVKEANLVADSVAVYPERMEQDDIEYELRNEETQGFESKDRQLEEKYEEERQSENDSDDSEDLVVTFED